jgi:MerR family copper efflux transcriptional regulator
MQALSIGQLAKSADVGIDTVRFYEKHGLLPKPQRRESGYRQYTDGDTRRLVFIRRAKELGFSLAEIGELLKLRAQVGKGAGKGSQSVERVRSVAKTKLQTVEAKIAELKKIRDVLRDLVDSCPGHGDVDHCPILRAFDSESPIRSSANNHRGVRA